LRREGPKEPDSRKPFGHKEIAPVAARDPRAQRVAKDAFTLLGPGGVPPRSLVTRNA